MITKNKMKSIVTECGGEETLADVEKIKGVTENCGCGCVPIPPLAVGTSGRTDKAASCADK